MKTEYYRIDDLNLIGKIENFVPYIFKPSEGWVVDNESVLTDRVFGYDGESIGASDMLVRAEKITKDEAMKIING